ncbi:MAG: (2Fe-2S)-binding protein [Anaerolineae bacterium]
MYPLTMTLNGESVTVEVEPFELLVDVLRDKLGLTGTKIGCNEGECGACTVIMDGRAVLSCLLPAMKAQGREVVTVEGLSHGDELHPLQRAFIEKGAVQCGYCTPGMIMSAKALLDENPQPSIDEIEEALAGNLCRCTGYFQIIEAIIQSSNPKSKIQSPNMGADAHYTCQPKAPRC